MVEEIAEGNEPVVHTLVEVVLDRSGSMGSIREATLEGLNSYIRKLQEETQDNVLLGMSLFHSSYHGHGLVTNLERLFFKPLPEVGEITLDMYQPGGGTPLYDAVGQIIAQMDKALAAHTAKPSVLLVIVTDGANTDNHGYQSHVVKSLLEARQKDDGWTVVYLGANQDAWAVGSTLGVFQGNAMTFDVGAISESFAHVAAASNTLRGGSYTAKIARGLDATYSTAGFYAESGLKEEDFKEKKEK